MRRKTQDEFIIEAENANNTVEILSEYNGYENPIRCKCRICGSEWVTTPSSVLQGCGCKKCGHIRTGLKKRIAHCDYVDRLRETNPTYEILETYIDAHTRRKFRCLTCGEVWSAEPTKILNKLTGCPNCGNKNRGKSSSLTQQEFIDRAREKSPNIDVLGTYMNNCTPVKMRCRIHDITFNGNPRCLLYKGGNVCYKCNEYLGEKNLAHILEKYSINYEPQYSIDDCRYIGKLKFDAFDVRRNIAYEYQGEQHYKPVDFAGCGDAWAEHSLEKTQLRDEAKREYCKANGIILIEIPYWERDNMEAFLIDKWREINLNIA